MVVQRRSLSVVLMFALGVLLALSTAVCGQGEKAVIVVGPVDPPGNCYTNSYIAEAEIVAQLLVGSGYEVTRLYHPHATWERVREASRGAEIFVYYGHGNGYGWYGFTDNNSTNGLCLSDPENKDKALSGPGAPGGTGEELKELELAPGALVALFHACYAAGSTQYDRQAVAFDVAGRRVEEYAQAFFRAGAGRYFASSYVGAAPAYFRSLGSGKSARQAFLEEAGNQQLHQAREMLLVEDRNNPNDPCPWAEAYVERPAEIALAPQPAASENRQQSAAEERQSRWFRDIMVMISPAAPEGEEGNKSGTLEWNRWRSLHQGNEGEFRLQSVFLRSLHRWDQSSREYLDLGQFG
jgi:hypothetical protein